MRGAVLDAAALGIGWRRNRAGATRANEMAAAHMAQGSSVTYRSASSSRSEPSAAQACADRQHLRMRRGVGQLARAVAGAAEHGAVGIATTTAPTGTSPRAAAASASAAGGEHVALRRRDVISGRPKQRDGSFHAQRPRQVNASRASAAAAAGKRAVRAHAHRQGAGARRPVLAPRGRALDRGGPRQPSTARS